MSNFNVLKIEAGYKPDVVIATVTYDGNPKEYTYARKNYGGSLIISGIRISFDDNYQITGTEKIYESKGMKKLSTEKSIGSTGSTSSKIKDELKTKGIRLPEVKNPIPSVDTKDEVHHEKYEQIKTCLECGIPVYLAGPAGSGKNHMVEQIAKEMGWNFYFSNSVQQEYKLTGFIDAGGKFHDTEFYKACTDENECIFFLDEMDASIPEVLVLLNAAIANGYFEFPNGRVNFNHVHFVAAGNTVGSGADDAYTGRMVLDQATLDRFAIIEFDYSLVIEMAITKNNSELVEFVHQLRKEAADKGICATFSYRCMSMIVKLEKAGMNLEEAIKITIVKGMDKDTVNTLHPIGSTKYHNALRKLQAAA